MDFLNNLVIPQPESNLVLMNWLLILALAVFLVYSGILFGSIALSVFFKPQPNDIKRENNYKLAKEYAGLITNNMYNSLGMGIVPFLAIIMLYTQLLYNADSGVPGYLTVSFVFFVIALIFIHRYSNSFTLDSIFKKFGKNIDKNDEEFNEYVTKTSEFKKRAGFWGITFLFFSLWIFIGSVSLAADEAAWEKFKSVFYIFAYDAAIIKFLHFMTMSLAITGITYIYMNFNWKERNTENEKNFLFFAREFNLKLALIFILVQPVFFLVNLLVTPEKALNSLVFTLALLAVFFVFLIANFIYTSIKTSTVKYMKYAFILTLFVVGLIAASEKISFGVSNKEQVVKLNEEYKTHHKEFLASLGRTTEEVSGEEIYQRCGACHKEEDTPAAPSHASVIGKYEGNKEALMNFIANPVKVDPEYPPMPNQGLKPNEVEAVAEYLLEKYGGKGK